MVGSDFVISTHNTEIDKAMSIGRVLLAADNRLCTGD